MRALFKAVLVFMALGWQEPSAVRADDPIPLTEDFLLSDAHKCRDSEGRKIRGCKIYQVSSEGGQPQPVFYYLLDLEGVKRGMEVQVHLFRFPDREPVSVVDPVWQEESFKWTTELNENKRGRELWKRLPKAFDSVYYLQWKLSPEDEEYACRSELFQLKLVE